MTLVLYVINITYMNHAAANPLPYLPPAIGGHIAREMAAALPPPSLNTPEGIAARDVSAIAQVAALDPQTAAEAILAVEHVVLLANALQAMAEARRPGLTDAEMHRAERRHDAMVRLAGTVLRHLERLQARRHVRQRNPQATAEAERRAAALTGLMMEGQRPRVPRPSAVPAPQQQPRPAAASVSPPEKLPVRTAA